MVVMEMASTSTRMGTGSVTIHPRGINDFAPLVRTPQSPLTMEGLKRYVGVTGRTIEIVEIDYLQHIALKGVFSVKVEPLNAFVFKGGTALQKTDITDRFSRDFDFHTHLDHADIGILMKAAQKQLAEYGFEATVSFDKKGYSLKIRAEGPNYQKHGKDFCKVSLKCDIRRKDGKMEPVILDPITPVVLPKYDGVNPYQVTMLHPDELVAEKVRAILTRPQIEASTKDVYDLFMLLNKGATFIKEVVEAKMRTHDRGFHMAKFERRLAAQGAFWNNYVDSDVFYRNPDQMPSFAVVQEQVLGLIKARRQ